MQLRKRLALVRVVSKQMEVAVRRRAGDRPEVAQVVWVRGEGAEELERRQQQHQAEQRGLTRGVSARLEGERTCGCVWAYV